MWQSKEAAVMAGIERLIKWRGISSDRDWSLCPSVPKDFGGTIIVKARRWNPGHFENHSATAAAFLDETFDAVVEGLLLKLEKGSGV